LALKGSGWLVGLPNPGEKPVEVCFGETARQFPSKTKLTVASLACPFVLVDFPLSRWDIDGHVAYSTAELVDCADGETALELTFAVTGSAELVLHLNKSEPENNQGWQLESVPAGWMLWLESESPARVEFTSQNGKKLLLKAVSREEVGSLEKAGVSEWQISLAQPESNLQDMDWRLTPIDPCSAGWFKSAKPCLPNELHLEQNRVYRGFGWYRSVLPVESGVQGFMIHSGGDVLSLYLDDHFIGTLTPGGGDAYLPLPEGFNLANPLRLVIRAEIWGHANFDDHRLPSLRLKALRGMGGLTAIQKVEDLTPNWFYQHRAQIPAAEILPGWPMLYFGGWSTTDEPSRGVYYRDVSFVPGLDHRVLQFPGLQINAKVFIDGQLAGLVNPFNPFIDISSLSPAGETARVAIVVEQPFRRPTGEVRLYQGKSVQAWELAGWGESELADLAENSNPAGEAVHFPVSQARGAMAWLHTNLPLSIDWEHGLGLQLAGQGLKVSAWVGKCLVGRLWLPSETRPRMTGGFDDRMVLPSAWLREAGGQLHLLLESVDNQLVGELRELKLIQDI
jgi:beta-galactosidase